MLYSSFRSLFKMMPQVPCIVWMFFFPVLIMKNLFFENFTIINIEIWVVLLQAFPRSKLWRLILSQSSKFVSVNIWIITIKVQKILSKINLFWNQRICLNNVTKHFPCCYYFLFVFLLQFKLQWNCDKTFLMFC